MPTWLQQMFGGLNGAFGPGAQQTNPSMGTQNPFGFLNQQYNNPLSGLLGAGLLGAGLSQNPTPGYADEARQAMRNIESPQGYASTFGNTVSGLQNQFLPLMQQQAEKGIQQISQQYQNAFPGTVGAQGPQFQGLEKYLREQLVPTQQAFLGGLGMQGIGQQQQAAYNVLNTAIPNQLGSQLSGLGSSLLNGGGLSSLLGTAGNLLGLGNTLTGGSQQGGLLQNLFGGGGGGTSLGGGLDATSTGNLNALSGSNSLFPSSGIGNLAIGNGLQNVGNELFGQATTFGSPMSNGVIPMMGSTGNVLGTFNPSAGTISDLQGNVMASGVNPSAFGASPFGGLNGGLSQTGQAGQGGLFGTGLFNGQGFWAPQAAGTTGLSGLFGGTGLLGAPGFGTMAGIGSGLASGGAGFGLGNLIGGQLPGGGIGGEAGGSLAGGGAGALAGFALGGPIGAALGGVAGLIGGLMGGMGATQQQKAANLAGDQAAQSNNVSKVGAFWTMALGSAGMQDLSGWNSFVQSNVASNNMDAIATEGAKRLLPAIQQAAAMQGKPIPASLDQVPGFRDSYINYIMANYQIGNTNGQGGTSSVQNIGQAGSLLTDAGIPTPGTKQFNSLPMDMSQFYSGKFNPFTGSAEIDVNKAVNWMAQNGIQVPASVVNYLNNTTQGGTTAQILQEFIRAKNAGEQPNMSQFGL